MMPVNYVHGRVTIGNRLLIARTCITCGIFMDSKHFKRNENGYWTSTCFSCVVKKEKKLHPKRYRATITRIQKATQKKSLRSATNMNKYWSKDDLDQLVKAIDNNVPYKEIAHRMNRSFYGINSTVARYGLGKKMLPKSQDLQSL